MNKKLLLYLLCGLFIIDIKHCYSDITLSYFQANLEKFFKMAPKNWHNYIRMFMYRYLKYIKPEKRKLNSLIFKIYNYSFIILALRDKSMELNKLSESDMPYKMNVTWASGMIYVSVLTYKTMPYTLHFYFSLSSEIRLNMTFISLHLSDHFLNCTYDKLEVHNSKETKLKYKYWRCHSNFNFYPEFKVFTIMIKLYLRIPFHLNAIFSVTDNKLIFSPTGYPLTNSIPDNIISRGVIYYTTKIYCLKVGSQHFVTSYHIKIIKIYRVHLRNIKSKEKNFVIYDGPGYGFNILNRNGEKSSIIASTFQCLVQFLLNDPPDRFLPFYFSNIESDNKKFKKIYIESEILIQIPFISCWNNLCVHHLEHKKGWFLNFTVLNISVSSPETSTCLYQGLYIGEHWLNEYRPIGEMCSEFNISSQSLMPTFHTRGSSAYIALYWYEGFTSITAAISISTSKCQGVYLDICRCHQYCTNEDYHSSKKFRRFIDEVTQYTMLKLDTCHVYRQKQTFSVFPGGCVILILSDKLEIVEYLNNVCKITVDTYADDSEIPYIDGFLGDGNYMELVGHKDCFSSKQSICKTKFNDTNISEFHHLKFIKRFRQNLSNEIDTVHIRINSRHYRNQVNIMLIDLKKKRLEVHYAFIAYKPNLTVFNILLGVTLQLGYAMGLDLRLSAERNLNIDPESRHTICSITIQRESDLRFYSLYTNSFSTETGKSF